MRKIVELKIEETKTIVGGNKIAIPSVPVVVSSNPTGKLPNMDKSMMATALI